MNVSDGYAALAEIYARFGKGTDPKEAFAHIDAVLQNGHATNIGLKQVICAIAFDRGTLLGMMERASTAAPGDPGDAFFEIAPFLMLPIAPEDPPEAAPSADKPRIIMPGTPTTH